MRHMAHIYNICKSYLELQSDIIKQEEEMKPAWYTYNIHTPHRHINSIYPKFHNNEAISLY